MGDSIQREIEFSQQRGIEIEWIDGEKGFCKSSKFHEQYILQERIQHFYIEPCFGLNAHLDASLRLAVERE